MKDDGIWLKVEGGFEDKLTYEQTFVVVESLLRLKLLTVDKFTVGHFSIFFDSLLPELQHCLHLMPHKETININQNVSTLICPSKGLFSM